MAELPELSARLQRLHALRWNELRERFGFTGDHLQWHESSGRRRAATKPRFSLLAPPTQDAGSTTHYGPTGAAISYQEWHRLQMEAWTAREVDPYVIDTIGIVNTIAAAKARLEGIIGDYLSVWAAGPGNSDDFAAWMPSLIRMVEREVGDVWQATEWHTAWFDRACRKKVVDALAPVTKEWQSRASRLEMQHLENPHLSISSLLAADGKLNFAFTLEQGKQTIESAEEVLRAFRTSQEGTKHGDEDAPGALSAGAANKRAQETIDAIDPFADISGRQPLGDNPFPAVHPQHLTFDRANWDAEKELADLKLELFRRFQASTKAPAEVLQLLLTYRLTRFDVIASKMLTTVDGTEAARKFEDWVRAFAKFEFGDILGKLSLQTLAYPKGLFPLLDVEGFRLLLMQKVEQHNTAALSIVQAIWAKASGSASAGSVTDQALLERSFPDPSRSTHVEEAPGTVAGISTASLNGALGAETQDIPSELRNLLDHFVTSVHAIDSLDIPDVTAALQPLVDAASAIDEIYSSHTFAGIREGLEASACALEGLDREAIDQVLKSIESLSETSSSIHADFDQIASNLASLQETGARVLASLDVRDLTGVFEPFAEATRATQAVATAIQNVKACVSAEPEGVKPAATATPVDEAALKTRAAKPGELIDRYLVAHPEIANHEALADLIGISRDVLFAIKGEIRWVRSSAYECTAMLIGCNEQDLHPLSVRRMRRKGKSNRKANSDSDS